MRVALVHYWLVSMRGGEKVLESLCRLFPDADIFTHVYNPDVLSPILKQHTITTSFIQKLPFSIKAYQKYLPLMPLALEQLDLRGYDLVISSESGPAKGVLTHTDTPHICYCHTPMRYLWDFYQDYLEEAGPVTRMLMRPLFHKLRIWDVISANRVDHFVANSHTVSRRIARHYRRDSTVIHPPVDTIRFAPTSGSTSPAGDYYLCLGQLTGYKRTDLAVEACTRLKKKLVIVGQGPDEARLRAMAGPTVTFAGRVGEEEMVSLVHGSKALLFPGEEDFGIVPVEVMAAGKPVIAYGKGGATETVVDTITGLFFAHQTVDSLIEAMETFENTQQSFDPERIIAHAAQFSEDAFAASFMQLVEKVTTSPHSPASCLPNDVSPLIEG